MRQTARIISTYTSDTSGVASALYELGGMTVIHDASGCNSTYNTHDEPRWYDMDSSVFISALTEMEAIMGDDEKLVADIERAAEELHPKFIALCGTPIPMMTGFDYEAVARLAEERTKLPVFGIPTNGMHTYVSGAGQAFAFLAQRMVKKVPESRVAGEISVNILGMTPPDFSVTGMTESLMHAVESAGFPVLSNWAMNGGYGKGAENAAGAGTWACAVAGKANLAAIERASAADVNLVVSASGLAAAKVLQQRFGTPYVTGVPIGEEGLRRLAERIRAAAAGENKTAETHTGRNSADRNRTRQDQTGQDKMDQNRTSQGRTDSGPGADIILIGEPVMQQSLAEVLRQQTGRSVLVLSPVQPEDYGETEQSESLLQDGSVFAVDEDDLAPYLEHAQTVIADPLYEPVCPKTARFIANPHEAFSGRIYRRDIPNLIRGIPENWKL